LLAELRVVLRQLVVLCCQSGALSDHVRVLFSQASYFIRHDYK
jgi:hypothetical protein